MVARSTRGTRIAVTFFAGLVTWTALAGMHSDWRRACEGTFGRDSQCFLWPTFLGAALIMLGVWFYLARRPDRQAIVGWSSLAALIATFLVMPGSGNDPMPPHCSSFFGYPVPCASWVTPVVAGIVAVATGLILLAVRGGSSGRPAPTSFVIGFVSTAVGLVVGLSLIPVYRADLADGEACWSIFSQPTRCEPGLAIALAVGTAVAVMGILLGYRRFKRRRSEPLARIG